MSQFLTVCMVAREPFQLPLPISLPSVQWPHIFRQNRLSCGWCAPCAHHTHHYTAASHHTFIRVPLGLAGGWDRHCVV